MPRSGRRSKPLAATLFALDAGYLLSWLMAPSVPWCPWVVVAGLAVGGWALARSPRASVPPVEYILPAVLPCTAARRSRRQPSGPAERRRTALATVEQAARRVGVELGLTAGSAAAASVGTGTLGESSAHLRESARDLPNVDEDWLKSLFDAFVDLVAVFVIKTLVAPLGILFLLWRLWRRLVAGVASPPRADDARVLDRA